MKLLLFTLITFMSITLFGQIKESKNFKVLSSSPYETLDKENYTFAIGTQIISIKINKKEINLLSFEGEKLISRKVTPKLDKSMLLTDVVSINNEIYLIYITNENGIEGPSCYSVKIDRAKLSLEKEIKLFTISKPLNSTPEFSTYYTPYIYEKIITIKPNADNTALVFYYTMYSDNKKDKNAPGIRGFVVCDNDMKKIWSKEIKLAETESRIKVVDLILDHNFVVHLLVKSYNDDSKKDYQKDGKINHSWSMMSINEGSIVKNKIELEDEKMIRSISLIEKANASLFIAGYYSNNTNPEIDGMFTMLLTEDGEQSDVTTTEFDVREFRKFQNEKQLNKQENKKGPVELKIKDLLLRDVILHEDGSLTAIGEEYYYYIKTDSKGNVSYIYCFKNIYIMNVTDDGTLNWFRKIPKEQLTQKYESGGFRVIQNNDDIYLVYIDNVKNINLKIDEKPEYVKSATEGMLSSYKIDRDGNIEQHPILDTKLYKDYTLSKYIPSNIVILPDGFATEFYIRNKQDLMIRVKFNNK